MDAYGRIVHLQPVAWKDGWPVIGADPDGDGRGEPVLNHIKPLPQLGPMVAPPTSDEFDSPTPGLQWQWQANPRAEWASLTARPGFLRLLGQPAAAKNLFLAPHLLLQKFPAREFTVTTRLEFQSADANDDTGLIVFGFDYAWIGWRGDRLVQITAKNASENPTFTEDSAPVRAGPIHLRATISPGALCHFSYSTDGTSFNPLGVGFQARGSRWVGAKVGLFASGNPSAFADYDWLRITAEDRPPIRPQQ